jgi:hypothetical protein
VLESEEAARPVLPGRWGISNTIGGEFSESIEEIDDRIDVRLVLFVFNMGSELPEVEVDSWRSEEVALRELESESSLGRGGPQ